MQVDRSKCDTAINDAMTVLLQHAYAQQIGHKLQASGDDTPAPSEVQEAADHFVRINCMSGSKHLLAAFYGTKDKFLEHCQAQEQAHLQRFRQRRADISRKDGDPGCADDQLWSDRAAADLKVAGNNAFREGKTKEALMQWHMALRCVQMAPFGDWGAARQDAKEAADARLCRLLRGLSHSSRQPDDTVRLRLHLHLHLLHLFDSMGCFGHADCSEQLAL